MIHAKADAPFQLPHLVCHGNARLPSETNPYRPAQAKVLCLGYLHAPSVLPCGDSACFSGRRASASKYVVLDSRARFG
jgi:hypothetical protein